MPTLDQQILDQNPWWLDPGAVDRDPHLRGYEESPVRWDPPAFDAIALTPGDTHTLRGPRQVGKSTTVKRLVRRLVAGGEARVLYFTFDLHRDYGAIADVVRRAKQIHPDPDGPWYLLLDEVTSVPDWQMGVKYAWDTGLTREDSLLLTGSSAHDLRRGAEQLPGRRGAGQDFLQLPMSFRDFCRLARGIPLPEETIAVEEYLTDAGHRLARRLYLLFERLEGAFRAYTAVGGFPAAVRDFVETGAVRPRTVQMLWSAIAGDIARAGRDQTAAIKLLEEVAISLGNPLKWTGAANAMDVGSPNTAKEYVERLSEAFTLLPVYFWDRSGGGLEPQRQRKIYYLDPLFGEISRALIPGARPAPEDGMVENLVAIGLFRSAAQALIQAGAVPGSVAYWRSRNNREVDFLVPRASEADRANRFPIEVKGDNAGQVSDARMAIRKAFGQGIVASRTIFDWQEDVAVVPIPILLAGLRENARREATVA